MTLIQFNIQKNYEELLEFFEIHQFQNEMKMVETKLNVIKQSSVPILTLTTSQKRKRTRNISTVTIDEDEQVSQTLRKHFKCN